jgi:hypothetical protein
MNRKIIVTKKTECLTTLINLLMKVSFLLKVTSYKVFIRSSEKSIVPLRSTNPSLNQRYKTSEIVNPFEKKKNEPLPPHPTIHCLRGLFGTKLFVLGMGQDKESSNEKNSAKGNIE